MAMLLQHRQHTPFITVNVVPHTNNLDYTENGMKPPPAEADGQQLVPHKNPDTMESFHYR